MTINRDLDLILFGASGFTGGLIARYLAKRLEGSALRWGLAGRDIAALKKVRDRIGAHADLPLVEADAADPASLDRLAERTAGVISTVGPYQKHGSELVRACAAAGTDYADLCGEPAWMAHMIAEYDQTAKASGARILFSCGYDSVPFDLSVRCLQAVALERFGEPLAAVRGRVRSTKGGGFSGGTAASLAATREAAARDPKIKQVMADPFALCGGVNGAQQPDGDVVRFEDDIRSWAAPFVMATINTKNVHRTNALLGYLYGRDFRYDEMSLTGDGDEGRDRAEAIAAKAHGVGSAHKQGHGSSEQDREGGFFDLIFLGATADGRSIEGTVHSDHDPGYTATSMMIAEIALALRAEPIGKPGISTPAAMFGPSLMARFERRGVMRFR